MCEHLIKAGAYVNAETRYGETALSRVAQIGHVECMKMLIEAGADVNHRNKDGETALMSAILGGHYKCVNMLDRREPM